MGIVLILVCWVSAILFFFGRKVVALYDVLVSLLTHFVPLGPVLLVVIVVALIVVSVPKRTAD